MKRRSKINLPNYWYFHENSDTFFIAKKGIDMGNEAWCIYELGPAVKKTEQELRDLIEKEPNPCKSFLNPPELLSQCINYKTK